MSERRKKSIKTLNILLVVYVILFAFWWTHLLLSKNIESYDTQVELLKAQQQINGEYDEAKFKETVLYQEIIQEKNRQHNMISAEGVVFFMILMVGMWYVYRSFRQEIRLAQQQRNFLLSITHELKSPIASIRLILDTFKKRTLKPEQTQKLARNGISEAERLHALVNNLLLAARLDSRMQVTLADIELKPFLMKIVNQLQDKYPSAIFNFRADAYIPNVKADENAMTSIALNLLENAIKYSPNDCEIDIAVRKQPNAVTIEIADKGFGIPDDEKPKIFDKFYRVGSEDTRKTKGTGLGLYIVKSLLRVHKGTISVKNNYPKGTIFKVQLPITK
jgi:signal transduction histidine kinase